MHSLGDIGGTPVPCTVTGPRPAFEWPTVALAVACYGIWALATTWIAGWSLAAGFAVTAVCAALHSSLQHEALHGHPTRWRALNEALVFPALGLLIPYGRFRDTHLDHHRNPALTDPYDDPESHYLDPAVWRRLPRWRQALLRLNNTLLGRVLIGTAVSQASFMAADLHAAARGDRRVTRAWAWHLPAVALVLGWLAVAGQMPFWLYLLAAYAGLSLIKIRTFLEHRAHQRAEARTVIIERGGPLGLLFLNNHLHAVHHDSPGIAWYRLPQHYSRHRDVYRASNGGYAYRSYGQVARQYLLRAKDPVPHPFWR